MLKLQGATIYLSVLEREHCKTLYNNFEYDFASKTEPLLIGHSLEKADDWFEEIQKLQGNTNVRLGVFLNTDEVIGDVALQNINWRNRVCDLGLGITQLQHRGKGYGSQAVGLLLAYAFDNLGLERITANTLEQNIGAQKSLEKSGFVLEGVSRKAVYFAGQRFNKLHYGILAEEYRAMQTLTH